MDKHREQAIKDVAEIVGMSEEHVLLSSQCEPKYSCNPATKIAVDQSERVYQLEERIAALQETNRKLNRANQALFSRKLRDSKAKVWLPYWRICKKWLTELEQRAETAEQQRDKVELEYRRLMWLSHGHNGMYGDDGEMRCAECMIYGATWDYRRDPLDRVEYTYNRAWQDYHRQQESILNEAYEAINGLSDELLEDMSAEYPAVKRAKQRAMQHTSKSEAIKKKENSNVDRYRVEIEMLVVPILFRTRLSSQRVSCVYIKDKNEV